MRPQTTSSSRPYIPPFLRTNPHRAGHSHRPTPPSYSIKTAYSTDPSREFGVRMVDSPNNFSIHHRPEDNDGDEIVTNAEESSQVSPTDLAKGFQALRVNDYMSPAALVISPHLAVQPQAFADKMGRWSLDNLGGSCNPACSAPGVCTSFMAGPEFTSLSRSSSVSSASSAGVALGNLVNSDVPNAASKGFFARDEHNGHPSAVWNLPPTILPYPSADVVPFPSAVMPSPFALSPLPPSSTAEEPVVFSSEEEARIVKHNLGGLL